jgi:hypothetical protein
MPASARRPWRVMGLVARASAFSIRQGAATRERHNSTIRSARQTRTGSRSSRLCPTPGRTLARSRTEDASYSVLFLSTNLVRSFPVFSLLPLTRYSLFPSAHTDARAHSDAALPRRISALTRSWISFLRGTLSSGAALRAGLNEASTGENAPGEM